jgi:hypothetical protein
MFQTRVYGYADSAFLDFRPRAPASPKYIPGRKRDRKVCCLDDRNVRHRTFPSGGALHMVPTHLDMISFGSSVVQENSPKYGPKLRMIGSVGAGRFGPDGQGVHLERRVRPRRNSHRVCTHAAGKRAAERGRSHCGHAPGFAVPASTMDPGRCEPGSVNRCGALREAEVSDA